MMIAAKIEGTTETQAAAQQHAKLVDAAQQFEAIFLGEMLKPLQSKDGGWGDENSSGDGDSGGSGGTLASYGVESVARAIAKAGGLGIARQVVEKVSRQAEKTSVERGSTKV
jgi:peptidoglycan hydrolase FlgJ